MTVTQYLFFVISVDYDYEYNNVIQNSMLDYEIKTVYRMYKVLYAIINFGHVGKGEEER